MINPLNILTALTTEFVLTFFIVFVSSWSFVLLEAGKIEFTALGLINGLIISIVLWGGYSFSGAHCNPVITIINMTIKNMHFQIGLLYILTQLLSSVLAGFLINLLLKFLYTEEYKLSYPKIVPITNEFQAFIMEFILSFFYVLMYFSSVVDKRTSPNTYGFAIGAVVLLGSIAFGPFSGACVNFIRAFGPELIEGGFNNIYFFATLIGGVFGGFYYENFLLYNTDYEEDEDDDFSNMKSPENYNLAMNLKY